MLRRRIESKSDIPWTSRYLTGPALLGSLLRAGLLLAVSATVFGSPRALLIGVSYKGAPHVSPLEGIDLDIDRMEQIARDLGITDIRKLWDHEATLQGIRTALRKLGEGVGPNDLTLVYFSGHGTRVPDRGERDEGDGQDEALVPFDARPVNGDLENALVDDEFGKLLGAIGSKRLMLVVDACNSGTVAKSIGVTPKFYSYGATANKTVTTPPPGSRSFKPSGVGGESKFIGIMASQDDEYALATNDGSVFTNALHQAISEAMKTDVATVTVEELFQRIERKVSAEMERKFRGHSQHPNLFVVPGSEDMKGLRLPLRRGPGDSPRLEPPEDDELINKWTRIAERARQRIELTAPRQTFTLHPAYTGTSRDCDTKYSEHLLSIEIVAPQDGYLNIINAGQNGTLVAAAGKALDRVGRGSLDAARTGS